MQARSLPDFLLPLIAIDSGISWQSVDPFQTASCRVPDYDFAKERRPVLKISIAHVWAMNVTNLQMLQSAASAHWHTAPAHQQILHFRIELARQAQA